MTRFHPATASPMLHEQDFDPGCRYTISHNVRGADDNQFARPFDLTGTADERICGQEPTCLYVDFMIIRAAEPGFLSAM